MVRLLCVYLSWLICFTIPSVLWLCISYYIDKKEYKDDILNLNDWFYRFAPSAPQFIIVATAIYSILMVFVSVSVKLTTLL